MMEKIKVVQTVLHFGEKWEYKLGPWIEKFEEVKKEYPDEELYIELTTKYTYGDDCDVAGRVYYYRFETDEEFERRKATAEYTKELRRKKYEAMKKEFE